MRTSPLKKGLVALATALTCFAVLAAPGGATTPLTAPGTLYQPDCDPLAGSIKIHTTGNAGTPLYNIPTPGEDINGDPCTADDIECDPELPTGGISLTTKGTNTSGSWSATTPSPIKGLFTVTASGVTYQVDISIVTAAGLYNNTSPPAGYTHNFTTSGPNHIVMQVRFYRQTGSSPFNCNKLDLDCTMNVRLVAQSGSGFNGTLSGAGAGETARLVVTSDTTGGTALTPIGACDSALSSIATRHVTASLYFQF